MKRILSMLFASATLALPAAPELVDTTLKLDGAWLVTGRGEVSGKLGKAADRPGAVQLSYDFSRCPDRRNSFVRVEFGRELTGIPKSFTMELRSDTPDRELPMALWVCDSSGEVYLMRFKLKGQGWQKVQIPMMHAPAWKSGDGNSKPDMPLRLAGVLLDMPGDTTQGKVEIGAITASCDLEPVEITGFPTLEKYFANGRRPALKLNLTSRNKFPLADYVYSLKATDLYSGKTVMEKKGTFQGLQKIPDEMALEGLPYGQIRIEFTISRGKQNLISFKDSFAHFMPEGLSADPAIRAWEYRYSPLGGVFGSLSPEAANAFGASWIRFEHPNWRNNEIEPGVYDFTRMKEVMQPFMDANVRPVILQCLYHYPEFPELTDPARFSIGYGRHFREEAAALRGVVRHFELGNEDNGHTKFLYTEVARHAAAGIRSQQPLAIIANSGTAHIDYNWLEFQRGRGLLEYLDALCVHPYTNNSTPSQGVGPERGRIYEKLTQLNEIVDAAGGMKQLWSTEYGWPNSNAGGEHDRADLYVREMIVGDMAGLEINGLYTWDRDYGIVGRPAGVSIQTYARMREGRRLAGFFREGEVYVAVYERDGNATAAVWTPEAGTRPNPVRGSAYFDLFGNPLEEKTVKISQSPVYVRNVEKAVIDRARANTVTIARERLEKNIGGKVENVRGATLCAELSAWSRETGAVSQQQQTVIARKLDLALAQARFDNSLPASPANFSARRAELERQVIETNAELMDIPSVRYLLNFAEKLEAESAMMQNPVNPVNTMTKLVYDLADRFARDGYRVQFAVFSNLYMREGETLRERLVFVPGRRTPVRARISSYAPGKVTATVRPLLPRGWKAIPESRKVEINPDESVFADFQIECPVRPADRNLLQIAVELPGRPAMISGFNDLEIVPALTVEAEPVAGALPDTPLTLVVRNRESVAISGSAVVNTPDGNQELARFAIPELPPHSEWKIPVQLSKITPEVTREWRIAVRFKLDDGREFSVPADLDFVHATIAAQPPKIDSRLDEWSQALPLKLNKAEYTRGSYGDGWTPEDCSAVSMLMWDRNTLYFAAEVKDQTFNQQFTGDSTWQQDSIQLIFADPQERKHFEITLALTPAGPQAWGARRLLTDIATAIEYRDGKICYEAAIPWRVFPGELKKAVEKREFLYGIAVNDDDAIVPRRFLERFEGSIVHGKKIDTFARTTLGGEPPQAVEDGIVFEDTFQADPPGQPPLKWFYHRSYLPKESIRVVEVPDAEDGKALRLDNKIGLKPHHFAICIAELQLIPGAEYELSARVRNVPAGANSAIGVCADKWGNKSQSYMTIPPGPQWQTVQKSFHAPVNGNLNLIIRNTTAFDGMLIDSVSVRCKQ